jgi:hypothetical protein
LGRPDQIRNKRIKFLAEWGDDKKVTTVDKLFEKARDEFPFVTEKTLMDYSRTALRTILERRESRCNQVLN